ncbi:MAG: SGNH/GDSL hydrolase family protein [Bacteroidota bacterium]
MKRFDSSSVLLLWTGLGFLLVFLLFELIGRGVFHVPDYLKTVSMSQWLAERGSDTDQGHHRAPGVFDAAEKMSIEPSATADNDTLPKNTLVVTDSTSGITEAKTKRSPADTSSILLREAPPSVSFTGESNSKERILLVGDSQCGGLRYPLYSYCVLNGHQLVASVTWYSSTTKHWAVTDTLQHFLEKFKPTMVIIGLGLNEVFARDVEKRKKYIEAINSKVDSAGAKVFWLGPAAWVKDKGIVSAIRDVNGGLFFDATTLSLTRSGDGRHPDMRGYKFWFAHAAAYMTQTGFVDFSASEPYKTPGRDTKSISLSTHRL